MRKIAVTIAVAVLAVGTWIAIDKYTKRHTAIASIDEAAARLRQALEAEAAGRDDFDVEASLATVEASAAKVRGMNRASLAPLGDAADDYLVSAREILRRQADLKRARAGLAVRFEALSQHVKTDKGAADWTQQAVQLKTAADKDLRDARIATESYSSLLASLPASQAKIAPHVEPRLVIPDNVVADARTHALDAYAKADENMKAVAKLGAYRAGAR